MATKEELLEQAKDLDVAGRSSMSKEELEKAVADAQGSFEGKDSAASDPHNPEVQEGLSPSGQEALDELGVDSEAAAQADLALDASGPLHLESPSDREMTGAVSEEHAKEQEAALEGKPEDFTGRVTEAGFNEDGTPAHVDAATLGSEKDNLSADDDRELREVRAEDVIDFPPPPHADAEEEQTVQQPPSGAFHSEPLGSASTPGARSHLFEQKAVFYTDGLSGDADHNHERAYATPEILQSGDPAVRTAGDESESEAFQAEKSDADKKRAEAVKSSDDGDN